ncbi:MAG: DUF4388 domain-containing protein [Pseudomonadota bacterium]
MLDARNDLLSQALASWERVPVSLPEAWSELGPVSIERLLSTIEKERRTGVLELIGARNGSEISFGHGFITFLTDREQGNDRWTPSALLATILAWRTGKHRFVQKKSTETGPEFPLRPGQLLTLGWLLLAERRDRFLRRGELFNDFTSSAVHRPSELLLAEFFRARREGTTGSLEIADARSRRKRVTFTVGEVTGVVSSEPRNRIDEIRLRLRLSSDVSLSFLQLLCDWEEILECFHWSGLRSSWI